MPLDNRSWDDPAIEDGFIHPNGETAALLESLIIVRPVLDAIGGFHGSTAMQYGKSSMVRGRAKGLYATMLSPSGKSLGYPDSL